MAGGVCAFFGGVLIPFNLIGGNWPLVAIGAGLLMIGAALIGVATLNPLSPKYAGVGYVALGMMGAIVFGFGLLFLQ